MTAFRCGDCGEIVQAEAAVVVDSNQGKKVVCAECGEEYGEYIQVDEFAMDNSDDIVDEVLSEASIDGEL